MYRYAFLLGAHPTISLAEILNYLTNQKIKFEEYLWLQDILIIKIQQLPEEIAKLQNELGGIIKIFLIKEEFKGKIFQLEDKLTPEKLLTDFFAQNETKINFGLSIYANPDPSYAELNWLSNYAHNIKQLLKDKYSIRYVEDKSWNLSSVQVNRNRLIDTGAEIALIRDKDHFYIGKTLTVQDYASYSERDFDKPSPDAKSGMLPPKLAQMMLNITRNKKTKVLYDPFCGSGSVLQEALLLGLDVYGSDISPEAIKNTLSNLEWFIKLKKFPQVDLKTHIKDADATTVNWSTLNKPEVVIVTEPYLGPPLKSLPFPHQVKDTLEELSSLYVKFFKNLNKNFDAVQTIGIVFPVMKTREGLRYLDILEEIASLGYKPKIILSDEISKKDAGISPRNGFLYSRPDQYVLREIFVFERK
ncbi:hypothetical protein KKE14_02635 [Patescibacteria group bacterium]|nr:hypothetical protein [Patescibacteria group bacterium]